MLYENYTEELLGLKDVIITGIEQTEKCCHIYLEMPRKIHICPTCGGETDQIHDYRMLKIKDISSFGKCSILHLHKRRYSCPECRKNFYEKVPFLPRYHRLTNRLSAWIIEEFRKVHSMSDIAARNNLSGTTAARIFDHVSYPNPSLTEALSFDEFKGNTGGEKFQFIMTDPDAHKVLDILPTRRIEDLYGYFSQFNNRDKVKYVIIDMNKDYRQLAHTCFLHATLVADKYHVVRQVVWAFEKVRKQEQQKFGDSRRKYFKRSRRLLLKRPENLKEIEKDQVASMLSVSERLRYAYALKNEFFKVMDSKDSYEARKRLGIWNMMAQGYRNELPEFIVCFNTYTNWQKEILNSFDCPYTNGYTEGVNNKIKVLKRNAFGVRKFERFRNRILHVMAS
ncbi:MAG: ISL3 family transposase [Bacillota bacterium]